MSALLDTRAQCVDGIALVTGGGSGIGRAVAIAFHGAGASVAVADIDSQGARRTQEMIESAGGKAMAIAADVSDPDAVQKMLATAVARFGRVDFAANCAGIGSCAVPTADHEKDVWDKTLAINLTGVWLCMKHEIKQMLTQGKGVIVNIASGAGLVAVPFASAYVASKHGVVGLTRAAAIEYTKLGIRINAICPGYIRTPMSLKSMAETPGLTEEIAASTMPIGRVGEPREIADVVLWLCSEQASFMVGAAIPVDGGYTAV
jgi:NAD(P)-dependent dehydrogenase (short-subunit alcohol dehydrogenase family)